MFDELDTQTPEARESRLFHQFSERLIQSASVCPGLAEHLSGCDLSSVNNRSSLQNLPVLRKSKLMQVQQENPPFGGFVDESQLAGSRLFMSPGPVWEPQVLGADPWQAMRSLAAAGIQPGQKVHNAFSYHLTPGGFILDEGARALGCIVFPAGVGNTETQVQAIRQLQSQVYVGTPDYLQVLLDHANDEGQPLDSFSHALVSGGALFPAMRTRYQEQGIQVLQAYATADIGVIAYETTSNGHVNPGMIVNEHLIVEILVPGTDIPVSVGEIGELVITRLDGAYPLVRFGTGDLSSQIEEQSPCGRTQMRLSGWKGRADQRVKVKGMFIDPVQLRDLPSNFPELKRWRVVIERQSDKDVMQLRVVLGKPIDASDEDALRVKLSEAIRSATNLSCSVQLMTELPNDGVIIDDQRDYETS